MNGEPSPSPARHISRAVHAAGVLGVVVAGAPGAAHAADVEPNKGRALTFFQAADGTNGMIIEAWMNIDYTAHVLRAYGQTRHTHTYQRVITAQTVLTQDGGQALTTPQGSGYYYSSGLTTATNVHPCGGGHAFQTRHVGTAENVGGSFRLSGEGLSAVQQTRCVR